MAAQIQKTAVIVAAFGSTVKEAIESIETFAKKLEADYPEKKIVVAFTSGEILTAIREREPRIPSLHAAVTGLVDEGYSHIAVLSLHVTAGVNYVKMLRALEDLERMYNGRASIKASLPLAGSEQDIFTLASYLIYAMPGDIKPGDAVIYVGHGSDSSGSTAFPALNWALFLESERGSLNMAVSLESEESIKLAIQVVTSNKRQAVWLVPLLAVYGYNASTDIFNTSDNSISSRFHDAGHSVRPVKQGLVSNEAVVNLWKAKLRKLIATLEDAK